MKNKINNFIIQAGPIRNILYILGIITIVLKPDNSSGLNLEGLQFIPTLVLPVIAPLLITGFFLDMLMSRIYASEQPAEIRQKFKNISRIDLLMASLLLIFWVPYLLSMS
ncbi:MAG: hypothetical protein OEY29_11375 [Gammaproteobacteria bacterium]|nr:hypothetical protein [Gammaproteobacteria bacterium]